MNPQRIARISVIAALYAACTLVVMLFMGWMAWGPVQFRISEALTVLALFTADAIPGLSLGCFIANVANVALAGMGTLGLFDVIFGTLATALGAWFTWHFRDRPLLALLGPVLANGIIVPAYLPFILQGLGFYTIPFTSIDLEGAYLPMYLFGLVTTSFGEATVMYVLGLPTYRALARTPLVQQLASPESMSCAAEEGGTN